MNIVGIFGSPSTPSRSAYLLELALSRLDAFTSSYCSIRPRDLPAQALTQADFGDARLQEAVRAVGESQLVIVATPIYKASYSGVLKAFLDLLPQDGLRDKTVLPLATGGSPAHLLALDYALKPVLSALGARDILDGIYATDQQLPSRPEGGYTATGDIVERLDRSVQRVAARARELQQREAELTRAATASANSAPWPAERVRWSV
ncbi:NADPH-dependent FMN reductase [Cupriavidus gilardii]|uniref:NADPH-dependent FMN reductase n=1 Tax=Cupriavidus gilardii TaxID=82541 RepID=UPI0021C1D081|nr:NADPH-dependent FMN reductase [Cupriavidus gilardii]MCT9115589.1 NADPH-dependent FMN reductase [Cupriavidus gilardii]